MHKSIYIECLSFNQPNRKNLIEAKFSNLGLDIVFNKGVGFDDVRIKDIDQSLKRISSCMFGHLDMIDNFLKSNKEYGFFFEDDILIDKGFAQDINSLIKNFNYLNLDILLLGYLINFDPINSPSYFKDIYSDLGRKFYTYPEDLWGTQGYLLSRHHAKFIIDKYYDNYLQEYIKDRSLKPFSADWTITKENRRALIYRPYIIENPAYINQEIDGLAKYRQQCCQLNYNRDIFL